MLASPHCPRCGADLDRDRSRDDVKPRVCPSHHGVFLDREEAESVFHPDAMAPLASAVSTAPVGDLVCPRCGRPMRAFVLATLAGGAGSTLEVDGCGECGGFWFDSGELGGIGGEEFRASPPRDPRAAAPPAEGDASRPREGTHGRGEWTRDVLEVLSGLFLWWP